MPVFLDTTGNLNLAVGVCGRCHAKFPKVHLHPDGNIPGLLVCGECSDVFDPWRLPARAVERINIDQPRPDDPIITPNTPFVPDYPIVPNYGVPGALKFNSNKNSGWLAGIAGIM
jgi:hypothetical protein